jgi:hypothetical protein
MLPDKIITPESRRRLMKPQYHVHGKKKLDCQHINKINKVKKVIISDKIHKTTFRIVFVGIKHFRSKS